MAFRVIGPADEAMSVLKHNDLSGIVFVCRAEGPGSLLVHTQPGHSVPADMLRRAAVAIESALQDAKFQEEQMTRQVDHMLRIALGRGSDGHDN